MNTVDRTNFHFAGEATRAFAFLGDIGFLEIEVTPTLVRYQKGNVEVDIYHGRQSYEVGLGIAAFGARYSISEIMQHADPESFIQYRHSVATTPQAVVSALNKLSILLKRYCYPALCEDQAFFSALLKEKDQRSKDYALDVLASQFRPKADEAFRRKDYAMAIDLYSRFQDRLSPTESKKLFIAKERNKNER